MLTEPPQFVRWLAPGSIELRKGGRVHIDFGDSGVVIDSTVLALIRRDCSPIHGAAEMERVGRCVGNWMP
ncbi:hypothetical protein [Mesorhizobium sp. M2C.T.Ca.TU.002.02.1.1]|uniref:hypothetical protein n=1 Tax=Mesorhizobium sp. M2C.T.Ca.TU.002.02.1.1 TaxID=2496788 RepID=UPI002478430C|nr:hypothetical protein [Mesorhizobium sp. M2C.T.Ca.TU.002.02.1.1]